MGAFISPNSPNIIASMSSALIANLRTGNFIRLIQGASSSNSANLSFDGNPLLIREVGTNSITLNTICTSLGGSTVSLTRVVFNDRPTSDFQYQGLFSIGNPLVITASSLLPSIAVQGLNSRNDNGGNYTGVTTSSTFYSVDASIQNLTYTLPDARVTPGRLFMFNKIDSSSSSVTFQTTYTQSILGLTSHTLWNQYDSMTLVARSTGTQGFWEVQSMYKEIEDKVYIRSRNSSATHSIFYVNNSNNSNILTITNNRNVGIGTTSPTNLLHIFGTGSSFRLQDGSQGSGRYLVSNNDGVASWTSSVNDGLSVGSGLTKSDAVGSPLITLVDTNTGLYNDGNGSGATGGSHNWINWNSILGVGLTWSGSKLSSTVKKYTATHSFTASVTQSVTHNLGTTDILIQMFDSSSTQIFPQYSNRTSNSISITTTQSITARVVVIG